MAHWPALIIPLVWLGFIAGPILAVVLDNGWWLLLFLPIVIFW